MNTIESFNQILKSFKIKATCVAINQHRHFSFYDLELAPGTRVNKLHQFSNELALALRAKSSPIIKIMAEQGIVRLQLAHKKADLLKLFEMYNASEAKGFLPFLLGETNEGKKLWVDMSQNPHLLVAGSTGSGKSVFLHNLIANAAKHRDVKLYLVDTKKVEFSPYDKAEFSGLVSSVAKDYASACNLMDHLMNLMEMRYSYLDSIGASNINQIPLSMDKIVVIIDEMADLMLADRSGQFENSLVKLAAKSRAAGIYIVAATQRPSVDVITGLIKANFPARLACKVSSRVDSQIILDYPGAENLMGQGDAIFKSPTCDSIRLQVAYVSAKETAKMLSSQFEA